MNFKKGLKIGWLISIVLFGVLHSDEPDKYINKNIISLKGKSDPNVQIEIYVNERKSAAAQADEAGGWQANDVPVTKEGLNNIYALAVDGYGTKSKTSTRLSVMVDKVPPKIYQFTVQPTVVKPLDSVNISVKTDLDVESVSAVMPDNSILNLREPAERGSLWTQEWVVPQRMTGGSYKIMLMAKDKAGNTTQQSSDDISIDAFSSLVISYPEDGALVYEDLLNVKGIARSCSYVMLNGERTQVAGDSQFSGYVRLVTPGKNKISVQAYGNDGSSQEQALNVVKLVTYPDIKNHWARREIEFLATLGYVQAYPGTNIFCPENFISRAELAALLVRSKQLPLAYSGVKDLPVFKDVRASYWANSYIGSAARYGLVEGYPGNVYKPQNMVTRAEAAAMFTRYGNISIMRVERASDIDVSKDHWASSYIAAFKSAGLMPVEWKQAQRFFPDRPMTRAEVCAVLARVAEINSDIESLIGKKTNWDYAIDNSPYVAETPDELKGSETRTSLNISQDASAIIVGMVSAREVVPGNDINVTVATLLKMKSISALFPGNVSIPMQLNLKTDLWEVNWKVPADQQPGEYQILLTAVSDSEKRFIAKTNQFRIIKTGGYPAAVQKQSYPAVQEDAQATVFDRMPTNDIEFVYPEMQESNNSGYYAVSSAQQSGVSGGVLLNRGKMTVLLAKYGKLREAKVSAAPAKDVPLSHPYVRTIKSGIVTGIVPNVSAQRFYPEANVSKRDAAAVLRKAKCTIPSGADFGSNEYISEAEFDNWLKKRVK